MKWLSCGRRGGLVGLLLLVVAGCSTTPSADRSLLALHSAAEQWQGVPYRFGGSSRRGIDCSALVQALYRDVFAVELPRSTREQQHVGQRVRQNALRPGDVVFFRPEGYARHNGVYLGQGRFVHASSSRGVIISRLDRGYWAQRYWKARRVL